MREISIYRKRYIPNEVNNLKDDKIIYHDDKLIITSWNALKPRKDISRGVSAYFIDKGYKVSKLYDSNEKIVYWYCDIINTVRENETSFIFEDLLLDVVVYEDGRVVVLDADELAQAVEEKMISVEYSCMALRNMNSLLNIIYMGKFNEIKELIGTYEK